MTRVKGSPKADIHAARLALEADTRAMILSAATAILRDEGPGSLTLRRIAAAVNASTKVVYTYFGDKDGLLDALYLQSFADLTEAMRRELDGEKSSASLFRVCHAYRDYALAQPTRYNIMFGDLGRAYEAPLASRRKAFESFNVLRRAVEACLAPERASDSGRIARLIWAVIHGVVSLEIRNLLEPADENQSLFGDAVASVASSLGAELNVTQNEQKARPPP
jgi:AcrR family transcriptional regulator